MVSKMHDTQTYAVSPSSGQTPRFGEVKTQCVTDGRPDERAREQSDGSGSVQTQQNHDSLIG